MTVSRRGFLTGGAVGVAATAAGAVVPGVVDAGPTDDSLGVDRIVRTT